MQHVIHQSFSVRFSYDVVFTQDLFALENRVLAQRLLGRQEGAPPRVLCVLDSGVAAAQPGLAAQIARYARAHGIELVAEPFVVPGGEACKEDAQLPRELITLIDRHGICRHSYLLAVGGGAVLDMAGFAAATAHRGIRLVRVPTTVLAQNDAGVGVKNGINAFGKKNFIGTFQPPDAVLCDVGFLRSLDPRDWRAGLAEAVKIALIRDAGFFEFLEQAAGRLVARDLDTMQHAVRRCAELHLAHIAGAGDPFEHGSARPLDFGHWAAHRLEALSAHRLRHGEAVAIGIALDTAYSHLLGALPAVALDRVFQLLQRLGFALWTAELEDPGLLEGLAQFREHLGGTLTVTLLREIGQAFEVHEIDKAMCREAIALVAGTAAAASAGGSRRAQERVHHADPA